MIDYHSRCYSAGLGVPWLRFRLPPPLHPSSAAPPTRAISVHLRRRHAIMAYSARPQSHRRGHDRYSPTCAGCTLLKDCRCDSRRRVSTRCHRLSPHRPTKTGATSRLHEPVPAHQALTLHAAIRRRRLSPGATCSGLSLSRSAMLRRRASPFRPRRAAMPASSVLRAGAGAQALSVRPASHRACPAMQPGPAIFGAR